MKLRIEKAIYGGDGLARVPEGKTVFVPGNAAGRTGGGHDCGGQAQLRHRRA